MLSGNNYHQQGQAMVKHDRFAIRKLSIGAMSILLGFVFLVSGQTVKADSATSDDESSNSRLTTYSGLNSFLKSNDKVKASTDNKNALVKKPAIVKNNQTNVAKDRQVDVSQTGVNHAHQGKWNNVDVTYDDDAKELTLLGGTEAVPAIMKNGGGKTEATF